MGIEKIKGSFESIPGSVSASKAVNTNRAYLGVSQDSVSFTGNKVKEAKTLSDFLLSLMPGKIRTMVNIHEGMGEVQNQIINAVGTGLVAPLFIKYNPLSETDQDTRTYTAWRQPVSAVLAVCTQAAIVIPFNRLIKKLADVGFLGSRYNSTLFPSDDFIKKEMIEKGEDIKGLSKKDLKDRIKTYKDENYTSKLKAMIERDEIIFNTTDGKTVSQLKMPEAEFKSLFKETIDSIIKEEEKQVNLAETKKYTSKLQRNRFYNRHPQESREVLEKLNNALSGLMQQTNYDSSAINADDVKAANKQFNKECKKLIKELKKDSSKKEIKDELISIVREIKDKNITSDSSSLRILQLKINKMLENVSRMETMDPNNISRYVQEVIDRRVTAIHGTIEPLKKISERLGAGDITVKEAQAIIDEAIQTSDQTVRTRLLNSGIPAEKISEHIEWIESSGTRLKTKAKSVAKCISDRLQKHAKANIDGMKRWTGLGVSLAILPVTCWLLNKLYPWFMDLAFPELSNKAAEAKAKKNQKVEVK